MRFSLAAAASVVLATAGSASAFLTDNWTVPHDIVLGEPFQVSFERASSLTSNDQYGILFGFQTNNRTQSDDEIGQYFGWTDLPAIGEQNGSKPLIVNVTVPRELGPHGTEGNVANLSAVAWGAFGLSGELQQYVFHTKVNIKDDD